MKPPVLWGTEEHLRELFGDGISDLRIERRMFFMRYRSPEHWLEFHRTNFGPIHHAFAGLDAAGQELLADTLHDSVVTSNIATDGTVVLPCEYLEVVAVRA